MEISWVQPNDIHFHLDDGKTDHFFRTDKAEFVGKPNGSSAEKMKNVPTIMMISFILVKSLLEIRYSILRQIMNREIISSEQLGGFLNRC